MLAVQTTFSSSVDRTFHVLDCALMPHASLLIADVFLLAVEVFEDVICTNVDESGRFSNVDTRCYEAAVTAKQSERRCGHGCSAAVLSSSVVVFCSCTGENASLLRNHDGLYCVKMPSSVSALFPRYHVLRSKCVSNPHHGTLQ